MESPKTNDSNNDTTDPGVATKDIGSTANVTPVPRESEDLQEAKDNNIVDGNGALGSLEKWERVMPDGSHEDDIAAGDKTAVADVTVGDASKKKRKKRKPASQRAAKSGTGFEEYYVDAPLKPEEHEVEKGLYNASLPFAQRIETAIQRYAAKRNMDSTRKNIFDKYLASGGIDSGPKMFSGGLDSQTLETRDAQDIALITATNFVDFEATDPRNGLYAVDFEGCLKSFLSYNLPLNFDLINEEYIKSLINVIRNFLNYLLYHDVCPEYAGQIRSSKILCDQGERELSAICKITPELPDSFNKACSELYGGAYQGQWAAAPTWLSEEESSGISSGISPALARQVFKLGIVANTSEEQFEKYDAQEKAKSISVTSIDDVSIEVVEAIPPKEDVRNLYASRGDFKPVGRLRTKTWHHPFTSPEDLTENEEIAIANNPKETKSYEFWVEDDILRNCFPGMKLEVTATELSIGISYFDKIDGIYCSFFDISPNACMTDWREPEGEGNWLPPRVNGGGAPEHEDEEAGADGEDAKQKALEDVGQANEETKEANEEA